MSLVLTYSRINSTHMSIGSRSMSYPSHFEYYRVLLLIARRLFEYNEVETVWAGADTANKVAPSIVESGPSDVKVHKTDEPDHRTSRSTV